MTTALPPYPLTPFILNTSMVGIAQLIDTGNRLGGWLRIDNESPYLCDVFIRSSLAHIPINPQFIDICQIDEGDRFIHITPSLYIPGAAPSSQLNIQVYPAWSDPPPGVYPIPMSRQAAPAPPTAKVGFSAFSGGSISGVNQPWALSVFNPVNNSKTANFYKGEVDYTGAVFKDAGLVLVTTDPNFTGGTIIPAAQTSRAPVPVSTMHCTANIGADALPGSALRIGRVGNNTYEFMLDSGDFIEIVPGSGLYIYVNPIPDNTSRNVITLQYTEQ